MFDYGQFTVTGSKDEARLYNLPYMPPEQQRFLYAAGVIAFNIEDPPAAAVAATLFFGGVASYVLREKFENLTFQGLNALFSANNSQNSDDKSKFVPITTAVAVAGAPKPPDPDPNKTRRVTNPKHNPNSTSPEPKNVDELFNKSIADEGGTRWAMDKDGVIHRFSKPSNGESHWNGSTSGPNPILRQNIPNYILRALGARQ